MSENQCAELSKLFYIDEKNSIYIHIQNDDIFYTGEINDASTHYLAMYLFGIDKQRKNSVETVVNLHLTTIGGDLVDSLKLYDIIRTLKIKVHCYIEGLVASGGSIIMCACDKILCTENSYIMVHEYAAEMDGKASDLKIIDELNKQLYDRMINIYKDRTGHNKITQEFLKEDKYLSAEEALELNLIDEVLYCNKKMAAPEPVRKIRKSK